MHEPLLVTRRPKPASPLVLCGVVGIVAAAALCAAQLALLRTLDGRIAQIEASLPSQKPSLLLAKQPPPPQPHSDSLPHKFVVDGLTPSADQAFRGDCWLFAVTGLLEDSYRRWGVQQGWYDGSNYLRLSRQALGISIMELCKDHPISICPANLIDGKIVFGNTTEGSDGADEHLLYWLRTLGDGTNVLPDSVCPYAIHDDWRGEWKCDGLEEARQTNPLHFKVRSMKSFYEKEAMKQALVKYGRPLSLGVTMVTVPHYLPCLKELACEKETAQCVPCPLERIYGDVDCCIAVEKPMVTMKGEWFVFKDDLLTMEGGHAVNIVGWNDVYKTEHGEVGGFIIRNTWADGLGTAHGLKARGSHTAAFYMQDIGDVDEALNCPNPHSARSWTQCETIQACTEGISAMEAGPSSVPSLECIDLGLAMPKGQCVPGRTYFLHNLTLWSNHGLYIGCYLYKDEAGTEATSCLPPATLDDMATVFTPPADKIVLNRKELCGYNFVPYSVLDEMEIRFGGMATSTYEIEWAKESYPDHEAPKYDYSLLKKSTNKLAKLNISVPNDIKL
uniref:C1 peptidase domain protein n=1 Tax=Tisochrysis lutea TaxID=1321669 RepID=X5CVC8_9EUKA